MTNLNNYTRQFTLGEVLHALGITSFIANKKKTEKIGIGFLHYKELYMANDKSLQFSLNNDVFFTIKQAVIRDLQVYVLSFDSRAEIKSSSSYISILLNDPNTLEYNTHRIFRFLKNREKRYEKLVNMIGPIKQLLKDKYKDTKLNLRLNSLNEIPKANKLQYNRLLDDILSNLENMQN